MKFMKLAKSVNWIFLGALAATGTSYALETTQKNRQYSESTVPDAMVSLDALLDKAEALITDGKPGDALRLLDPLEFEYAGEMRFDYLLGVAALDHGQPDKATFILERVLAVDPGHAAARLEMGRAYYQLGDLSRARTEFAIILKQTQSAEMRASVQKYLDAIDEYDFERRTRFSGYVEATSGHDSNVNASTDQQYVFVDRISGNAPIDPSSTQAEDNYLAAGMGGGLYHRLNARWMMDAGADLRKRNNLNETQLDSVNLEVRAGMMHETQGDRMRLGVLGGQYHVGGSRNSSAGGIKAEWHHRFSPANQFTVQLQQMQYRYADIEMQQNDFDQRVAGIGWVHTRADGQSSLSGSIYAGNEQDVSAIVTTATPGGGRKDGASRFSGARIGGQAALKDKVSLIVSTGIQTRDYERVNYYFLRQRQDRFYDLTVGANWYWDGQWTLRPQFSYTRNDSNITIFGYSRTDVSLTLRRDFR